MANKDTDQLFIFGNCIPDLSSLFDGVLSFLRVFDLGLSEKPFTEPLNIGIARSPGWQIFGTDSDCQDGS